MDVEVTQTRSAVASGEGGGRVDVPARVDSTGGFESTDGELTVAVVRERALIESVVLHPEVFPLVADDHATNSACFDASAALAMPNTGFVGVFLGSVCQGVVMFVRHSMTFTEVHAAMLPCCRGRMAEIAFERVISLLLDMPGCSKILTLVPRPNRVAAVVALRVGFVEEGVLTASYLKEGVLHDQRIFGLTAASHRGRRRRIDAERD